jgi:hypothetical protein
MKKKLLPLAMLAGLAGAVGTAQAAHLNADGLGQVLIYPYFNTLNGQHTDIHLVNTTNETKAVKIRFLEGQNSREVLDFHIYLSAYDHFSGVVAPTADGQGAMFKTNDTTCTVPAIPAAGVAFRNFAYLDDAGSDSINRTREGYLEIIEMGVLGTETAGVVTEVNGNTAANTFRPANAVKHTNGVPNDCSVVRNAWGSAGGQWLADPDDGVDASNGTGLYGFATVFNVAEGTSATYSATAIANFNTNDSLHGPTGDTRPSLVDVFPETFVTNGDTVFTDIFSSTNGADAVSALLTRDTLQNDYVTDEGLAAETDWVVTFPTKRFYMIDDVLDAAGNVTTDNLAARKPFTAQFTDDLACEHIDLSYYDREEASIVISFEEDFSPRPPTTVAGWNLCTEVNVVSFGSSDVLGSDLQYGLPLNDGFVNGWATIDFTQSSAAGAPGAFNVRSVDGDDYEYYGLPVAGFAVIKYSNGDVGGVLSNYVGVVDHKYTRNIQPQ